MFRHVVLLTLSGDAGPDTRAAILAELRGLPDRIPEIRSYVVGADAAVNEGNADVGVVADFDSVDDYLVYRDHPEHRSVIERLIAPALAGRTAIQFEW
jgi:hypothetical protein